MKTANRVLVNTIIQYTRLVVNVLVGLVTVRVLLRSLGASDYGLYDVIGGVIGMLSFISNSLAQTSIRFISVALGKRDVAALRKTFNDCFWTHLIIGLGLVFVIEFVGLFIFNGFLNIDPDRVAAAKVVYHCMTAALFLRIFATPFRALVIAHEDFPFAASLSIIDSFCKLAIAYVVVFVSQDKLIVYGGLMALINLLNMLLYIAYNFFRYKGELGVERVSTTGLKSVGSFAGWTLLDVLGSLANRQGYAIMLNKFFGTVTNAVFAIARQVEGHIFTVSSSVIDTMKPQIMKSKGQGDDLRMLRLSMTAGKFGFSMMSLIAIPLIVMMPDVLTLWLGEAPEGTALFSRLLVIACLAEQLTRGLVYANQAHGDIKWFSIIVSSIRVSALPISWIVLSFGAPAYVAIAIFVLCETLGSLSRVFVMSHLTGLRIRDFMKSVVLQILPPFFLSALFCGLLYKALGYSILNMVIVLVLTAAVYAGALLLFGLTREERQTIRGILEPALNRFRK